MKRMENIFPQLKALNKLKLNFLRQTFNNKRNTTKSKYRTFTFTFAAGLIRLKRIN